MRRCFSNSGYLIHPTVIGEPACGNLPNRREVLSSRTACPLLRRLLTKEARFFIDFIDRRAAEIGFIDVHLPASASLADPRRFWTHDRRLPPNSRRSS